MTCREGSNIFDVIFSPADRDNLRGVLITAARADARLAGAAVTGSASVGAEDRWSDIDLALSVADGADRDEVVADWTRRLYQDHHAAHHLDVHHGNVLFRVFLLASSLQVDLAFWPAGEFRAIAPTFRLVFGAANEPRPLPPPAAADLIGMGWLYALHVRSSIARKRMWQAEHMISAARDQVLALACLRHGLPAVHGRGVDQLPAELTGGLAAGLVRSLDPDELTRAFGVVVAALLREVAEFDAGLARRLGKPLGLLSSTAAPGDADSPRSGAPSL